MRTILLIIATQIWFAELRPKSWREGPIVDPGVFVITQIKECRNRMGYCILGLSCNVDSDFVKDDLGGHCDRLSEAFNPKATFVCCRQNPANFDEGEDDLEAVILETNVGHESATTTPVPAKKSTTLVPQYSTSVVTELITELQTQTETVTKIEEVTKVVTQIVTELVNENGVRFQDEYDIPENWNEPAEDPENQGENNLINTDEAFLQSPESVSEESINQDEVEVNIPDTLSATVESQGNINRMDETVLNSEEGLLEFSDNYDTSDFLPSLGAPSSFSSVLNTVPDILAGPWVDVTKTETESEPAESIPTWGELQTFGSSQLDDWEDTVDNANVESWDSSETSDQFSNAGNFLSPIATNNEGAGQGLVYEFEIGQTIPGAGASQVPQDGQATVLRPGLVIDDPSLLESIVSTSFVNVDEKKDNAAPFGSIVEVDLDEEYPSYPIGPIVEIENEYPNYPVGPIVEIENEYPNYPSGPIVEIETVPIFQNDVQNTDYNSVGDTSAIFYEPIGISDAIKNQNQEYIQDKVEPDYSYYESYQQETTVTPNEPEIHCDLSILLNGISCSFRSLDKEEVKTPPPLKYTPTIDRSDQVFYDEDVFISRPGLFEITPPVQGLDWPTSITTKRDNLVMEQDTEYPFSDLPSAVPAVEPPTVSQDYPEINKAAVIESDNAILEFDESDIDIKLPLNFLQTELGDISTNIPNPGDDFSAKIKKNYREAQYTDGNFEEERENKIKSSLIERDFQPRKEDSLSIDIDNTPKVEHYHNLNNLHEDAQLLQLFIEQIERASNITLVNATLINKPFSDQNINTVSNIIEDVAEPEPETKPEPVNEKETISLDTSTNNEIISATITVTESIPDFDIDQESLPEPEPEGKPLTIEDFVKEPSLDKSTEEENIFSAQSTLPQPKNNICGVKGGKSVEQAYGKAASKYIMPLLIDSWVFGKDQGQKARFEDTEARVIGGKVTSTVLYCWVAAILTEENEFVCTGTLVTDDLVLTSGSCINFLFKRGLKKFKVVLGDSNLKLELQFGVQEHKIMQALVHEDYDINDLYHQNDIGFVILRTPARLEENVCLLCLPKPHIEIEENSCTVTGYGKPSLNAPIPRGASYWEDKTTDGILREAQLEILDNEVCSDYVLENSLSVEQSDMNMTNLVCAGGNGNEKACFVAMDGGSPLACESNGHYYLGGMVTFGTACGEDEVPSMFVRVSEYVEWILASYEAVRPRISS